MVSTAAHEPSGCATHSGPEPTSVVWVPSGFAHVVDVAERSPVTSTREPCARAASIAEARSAREVTVAGFDAEVTPDDRTGAAAACPAGSTPPSSATAVIPTTATVPGRTRRPEHAIKDRTDRRPRWAIRGIPYSK